MRWNFFVLISELSFILNTSELSWNYRMTEFIETDTEFGRIRGVKQISALNVAYNSFLGLRYATPPIENLRFKVNI